MTVPMQVCFFRLCLSANFFAMHRLQQQYYVSTTGHRAKPRVVKVLCFDLLRTVYCISSISFNAVTMFNINESMNF